MKRRRLAILLILGLALGLRLYGIGFESFHPDEKHVLSMALKMVKRETFEPEKMFYGTLSLYAQAVLLRSINAVRAWMDHPVPLKFGTAAMVATRLISVLASLITVALTASLARFGLRGPEGREGAGLSGWLAPLFAAVAFVSVQCAHYDTVDGLMTMLGVASIVMTFRAWEGGRTSQFAGAGLLAGLSTATKYTGALSALPLLLLPLLSPRRPRPWRQTLVGLISVGIGFAAGMPYAFFRPRRFISALRFESNHYRTGGETIFAMGPHTMQWNLEFLFYSGIGPGMMVMAAFGVAWLISRWRADLLPLPDLRRTLLLLSYPVVAFLFVSSFKARFERNLLPLIPFLAVFAAYYVELTWRVTAAIPRLRLAGLATLTAAVFLTVYHPLLRDVVFGWQLHAVHTKHQLADWKRVLPPEASKVAHHEQAQRKTLAQFQEAGFDYIVMSSHSLEPVAAHPDRYPYLAKNYRDLFAKCEVVQTFWNSWFDSDFFAPHHLLNSATINVYHGPTLLVLKVPKVEGMPGPDGGTPPQGPAVAGAKQERSESGEESEPGQGEEGGREEEEK